MEKRKKQKKVKDWPQNLTAKEIRQRADDLTTLVDQYQNEYEELEREMKRRGLEL